ncbi:putative Transferase [Quillaja saponaria]|uniref:Transferase n=1 Tax=Quillaja saponaria TaxID=32244 RepID=A0AAD7PTC6_QUISA|nr:putative Transferase [Quillaja saponaria]
MAEVTYICKRTVVSTKPVQPGKYHSLSVLQRHMEKNHTRMVYYFQSSGEVEKITKKLRESLAELLTYFPIMSGRLIRDEKGNWMVKCNDAGVRMVEARAKGSVEDWLRNVNREKELKLVHWEEMYHKQYFWSPFNVQVTEFEEGGLAVGLSCIHILADPICATLFIRAWANITLGQKMIAPPFFHPLPPRRPGNIKPNHQPYTALIDHYRSSFEKSIPVMDSRYTTITLTFSDQMVRACMEMTKAQTVMSNMPLPTPFEALAGLFWVSLSKIKGIRNGLVNMSICLDMRKVLGLDSGFFGNCMVYNKVHAVNFGEHNLSEAATAIKEVVDKMDVEGIMDLIEWLESTDSNSPSIMHGYDLICANLEEINPYLTMFENEFTPIRASYYIEPVLGEGHVVIFPAPTVEGPLSRVVMVTLREDEAVKLCEDDLISNYSPTILMRKCE